MTEEKMDQASALAEKGKSLYGSKKYASAAESFDLSASLYDEVGDDCQAAEMRNNQAVALLLAKKPHQALEALEGTSEIFQEAGEVLKQGMALANQATALKDLGRKQEAVEAYHQAAAIFQKAGAEEMYLQTIQSVSSLKLKSRDVIGALYTMEAGLDSLEKLNWRQRLLKNLLQIPHKLMGN